MRVRLRLQRFGRKKLPLYRIVAISSSVKRDGKFLDILGIYHPMASEEDSQSRLDEEKIASWLGQGAIPTAAVQDILKKTDLWKQHRKNKHEQHVNSVKKRNQKRKVLKKEGVAASNG